MTTLTDSIVTGGSATTAGPNCFGLITSGGNNLESTGRRASAR